MRLRGRGLYISSWEYLYLGTGKPRGLPNQLFSEHPWNLILFKDIYCDMNGLVAESNAYQALGWVNSELFVRLGTKEGIIRPLRMDRELDETARQLRAKARATTPRGFQKRVERFADEDLQKYKVTLLNPFLEKTGLIAYDWSTAAQATAIPRDLQDVARDVLVSRCPELPLTRRMSELSGSSRRLFHDLQASEHGVLSELRRGKLDQERDVLPQFQKRLSDYRQIDAELRDGVEKRLEAILKVRDRFGKKKGWEYVSRYLDAAEAGNMVGAEELIKLRCEIEQRLMRSLVPRLGELGMTLVRVTRVLSELNPKVHYFEVGRKVFQEIREPLREYIRYVWGPKRKVRIPGRVLDI